MHFNAHILLYDSEGRILLQQRSDTATNYPELWSFFGGGAKRNEMPLQTVQRETFEELAVRPVRPRLFAVYEIVKVKDGRTMRAKRFIFLARCSNKKFIRLREGHGLVPAFRGEGT